MNNQPATVMSPNLIILAAGISSRMKSSVAKSSDMNRALLHDAIHKPKSMIGVGEGQRPLMDYLLYNAREAGYHDIVIVVGENDRSIREYYGTSDRGNRFHGLTISYATQKIPAGRSKPLGTADALYQALLVRPDWKKQMFTVCNSDNLYSQNALRLLLETTYPGAMIDYDRDALQYDPSRIEQFAITRKDKNGFLTGVVEKPTREQIAGSADANGRVRVSMNIFRFSYDLIYPILEKIPVHPVRQEKELPAAVMMLLAGHPASMIAIPLAEYVPDLTHPDDIVRVQEYLAKTFPNFSMK